MNDYIVSARKYRPMSFDSVVGQKAKSRKDGKRRRRKGQKGKEGKGGKRRKKERRRKGKKKGKPRPRLLDEAMVSFGYGLASRLWFSFGY